MKDLITRNFIPIKIHIKERPQDFGRFKAEWTPTVIVAEADGTERYRFSGFLPVDDFMARLQLGLAMAAFSRSQFEEAEHRFEAVASQHPESHAAAEAVYWSGVSGYKRSGKPDSLRRAGEKLQQKYPASEWAQKALVFVS